ncbi:Helix-turn-helix domain-containing protein [Arachidicoccus rhizosphaerae]|uniref:Helix-turn-helix domain-containing protein n=1 Tax=Arachidicoccus rhizosphaerae TaxID=551991 RepID=A0A1H3XSF4_9BACT|nr:response regulator transcription factor [Arachidicoccus rhizosphaerae]SEA01482.1 Helix-turn-helix domain-containing protein [Arachidicoccus rhizosphaerae]
MSHSPIYRLHTITEAHRLRGLGSPEHPLISVIDIASMQYDPLENPHVLINDFYTIALKKNCTGKFRYGQQQYDFDEGVMMFMAPQQIFEIKRESDDANHEGWLLLIHPDLLWNTQLAHKIKQYEYFGYSVNEALLLSDKEEAIIINLLNNIRQEYESRMDDYSREVMIAQLELLLTYAERFYHRQFLTRKISNHTILDRLEKLLSDYFRDGALHQTGIPTVQFVAEALNVSANYLSSLLKVLTGQSTQQHIHNKLIELAKEQLSSTDLTVSEIAYGLGFEHSQSFSKLFKSKTNQSPLAYRQSFS